MKKLIAFFISLSLLFVFCSTTFATTSLTETSTNSSVEYLDDGTYIITTIEEANNSYSTFATTIKDGNKTITYYNANNEMMWMATLSATFNYTGSSSTCTIANISYSTYDSNWEITSATATKSANKAIGNITAKHYFLGITTKTVERTLTLTCSADGTLS